MKHLRNNDIINEFIQKVIPKYKTNYHDNCCIFHSHNWHACNDCHDNAIISPVLCCKFLYSSCRHIVTNIIYSNSTNRTKTKKISRIRSAINKILRTHQTKDSNRKTQFTEVKAEILSRKIIYYIRYNQINESTDDDDYIFNMICKLGILARKI